MAIDRRPASGTKIGSLLINPGGPGESGVDFLPELVTVLPSSVLSHFDVVGFDPPGVGRTAPIVCENPAGLAQYFHADPAPTTAAGFQALVHADTQFADGCEAMSGSELPYVSTVDAAMDMDVIRRDVGDAKLTYLGFSYGTFLGATYAGLFPTRVRAMVLDGAIDPSLPLLSSLDQQSASLEAQLDQFLTQCSTSSSCPWKVGKNPIAAFEALVAQARSSPLRVPGTTRTVGPSELLYGTANGLYATAEWSQLAQALAQASAGNGTEILASFDDYTGRNPDGTYSNIFEANAAVDCLDYPPLTMAQIQADSPQAARIAPVFGVQNLDSEIGCAVWKTPATGRIGPIHAVGSPPIVVVGSTGDPITPYAWARSLAGQLSHGVLLTRVGDGHTAYGASSCIRKYVDDYLTDLVVPPAGTRCPTG